MPLGQRELQRYEAENGEAVTGNKWLHFLKALSRFLFVIKKRKQTQQKHL